MVKRKNLIWAAVFAAVIAAGLIFIFLTGGKSGENSAEIYENGKLIKTVSDLSPDKEYSFEIKTENGTNTITVGEGSIWVSVADCSNQTCSCRKDIPRRTDCHLCTAQACDKNSR